MGVDRSLIVVALVALASAVPLRAADPPITADEAKDHIGKRVTVCGNVAGVGHAIASGRGGKQTFLHLERMPPQCPFMAVIVGNDLFGGGMFYDIEKKVEHKRICVTGYVKRLGEVPMMLLDAPNQLKVEDDKAR
jgi:hypothetical protein